MQPQDPNNPQTNPMPPVSNGPTIAPAQPLNGTGQMPPQPYAPAPQPAYASPAYPYATAQPTTEPPLNPLSIVGLIFAWLIPLIGLILSIIALKNNHGNKAGKVMAIIGIVIGALGTLFSALILLLVFMAVPGIQHAATDTKMKSDLATIQSDVESYYSATGSYPTLAQLNDSTWRAQNHVNLNTESMSPDSNSAVLVADTPTSGYYSYSVSPVDCTGDKVKPCTDYTVSALLTNGQTYTQQSDTAATRP